MQDMTNPTKANMENTQLGGACETTDAGAADMAAGEWVELPRRRGL
jgi:hypothetical protein